MADDLELRTKKSEYTRVNDVWFKNGEEIGDAAYVSEKTRLLLMQNFQGKKQRDGITHDYLIDLINSAQPYEHKGIDGRLIHIKTTDNGEILWASDPMIHYNKSNEEPPEPDFTEFINGKDSTVKSEPDLKIVSDDDFTVELEK